jgi:hypothetical protein
MAALLTARRAHRQCYARTVGTELVNNALSCSGVPTRRDVDQHVRCRAKLGIK